MVYAKIKSYIENLPGTIAKERIDYLNPLVDYIQAKLEATKPIRLNLICTHNSRRSHLSQIWAQTMASYFDIPNVQCYSGGTEETAMYKTVIGTLKDTGFEVNTLADGKNPVYAIKFDENEPAIIGFSKTYNSFFNPKSDYAGVLTCSQVDEACPIIYGAEERISLPYEDPKKADNTPEESEKYAQRCSQIASEMKYVFSQLNRK